MAGMLDETKKTSLASLRSRSAPFVVFFAIVLLSIALSSEISTKESLSFQQLMDQNASLIAHSIDNMLSAEIRSLERMADRWEISGGQSEKAWRKDAENYLKDIPGLHVVAWVDPAMHVAWLESAAKENEPERVDVNGQRLEAKFKKAHDGNDSTILFFAGQNNNDRKFLYVLNPISYGGTFGGYILGVFDTRALLLQNTSALVRKYYGMAFDGTDAPPLPPDILSLASRQEITIGDAKLAITIWPLPALVNARSSMLPQLTLLAGGLLAGLIAVIVHSFQRTWLQAKLLRETEATANLMLNGVLGYAICMLDEKGNIMSWNRGGQRILQYEKDDILGVNFARFFIPEEIGAGEPSRALTIARASGRYETEIWQTRKDGSRFWASIFVNAIRGAQGGFIGFAMVTRDISDIKRHREALEKSEETFRQAMEYAPIGKALVLPDGKWLMVNPALCKIVGYSKEELIRMHDFQKVTHPEDLAADLSLIKQMLSREIETYQMEKRYMHKDGHIVWASLHASLVWNPDGTPAYFIFQIEDITERRRVENKFKLLFEHASDPHLIFNEEQGVIDCNHATLTLMQCKSKADLLGTHPAWFSPEYQLDGRQSAEKGMEMDSYAKQKGSHRFEWLHRKFNGEAFPIEVVLTPIDLYGKRELLIVWHDLTERKKAEKERETLIQKLVDSNSELERFAFIASHDLQEPLRLISNFTYLLQKEYAGDLNQIGQEYITIVINAAQRMHALIGDLLEYGRIDSETERYELFDGMQCAQFIQENLHETIKGADVKIVCAPLPKMYGNPIRFNALLQNLVSNSIKYQKIGTRPVIHIGAEEREKEWLFWVKDNGIGMKQEYYEQIFEPFRRLHNNSEYPGTGMGLAICRKIIDRMQGAIWVESVPDVGTTFYFTVPKHPPKAVAA